jgi:hypothetical protein
MVSKKKRKSLLSRKPASKSRKLFKSASKPHKGAAKAKAKAKSKAIPRDKAPLAEVGAEPIEPIALDLQSLTPAQGGGED